MTKHKKHPKKQLEKYSIIFSQIGLIFTLFITYLLIEYKTPVEKLAFDFRKTDTSEKDATVYPDFFEKEKIKPKKRKKTTTVPKRIDEIKKVDNNTKETFSVIDKPEDEPEFDINKVTTMKEPEEPEDDSHIYDAKIYTPVFKGCEGLENHENRKCFEAKLKKFVQKKFNTDLGLNEGVYRVFSEFVIDKEGNIVNIRIKAPSKSLEKEMRRVINKLPKFTPGKKGNKPVNVSYILPLAFKVD